MTTIHLPSFSAVSSCKSDSVNTVQCSTLLILQFNSLILDFSLSGGTESEIYKYKLSLMVLKILVIKRNYFIHSMESRIIADLHKVIEEEVVRSMQEHQTTISDSVINAMRSGAVTPAPTTPDPHRQQTDILQLLRQGQVNTAFQQVGASLIYTL